MKTSLDLDSQSWRIAIVAVSGLLLGILVAGVVGLALNASVAEVAARAQAYDVRLEDLGDDLRLAVLELRTHQRELALLGRTNDTVGAWEQAYARLDQAVQGLERLGERDADLPPVDTLRHLAEAYHDDVAPTLSNPVADVATLARASERNAPRLDELERMAATIDKRGEQRASAVLSRVIDTTSEARFVLVLALCGLLIVGSALAFTAVRTVGELRRLYGAQRGAARARADFLADVSHELRTPLTVLRANADVGRDLDRDCVHTELFDEIAREAAHMGRMVDDLVFLARSDSESPPLQPSWLPVAGFLADVLPRAAAVARQHQADLAADLAAEGQLWADAARIEQVVLILVDNAAKYSPRGASVALNASTVGGELRIDVIDRGPGIPPADLPRVFDRFYRVEQQPAGRSESQQGLGLGLAIARTILEAHGGRIEATSRLGAGTHMRCTLPLAQPAHARTAPRPEQARATS